MLGVVGLHTEHAFDLTETSLGHIIYSISGLSIPLFFITSGYLMLFKDKNYKYYASKIFNIVKFCFIICFFLCIYNYGLQLTPRIFIWNFVYSFLQMGKMSHFWYFGATIMLYLLTPLINRYLNPNKLLYLELILLIVITTFFVTDIVHNYESRICQTFRMWYWLFYYFLGGLICHYKERRIILSKVCLFIIGLLYFTNIYVFYLVKPFVGIKGVEFLFGSPSFVLLSFIGFLYITSKTVNNSVLIALINEMSKYFLPIYSFHITFILILRDWLHKTGVFAGILYPLFVYVAMVIVCLGFGWIVMRVKYVKDIFKI